VGQTVQVHAVTVLGNFRFSPPYPDTLRFGQYVTITYDHTTPVPRGFKPWIISGSVHYGAPDRPSGSGTGTATFSRSGRGMVGVSSVYLELAGGSGIGKFATQSIPVQYTFREF
jgi:hypothetical protein